MATQEKKFRRLHTETRIMWVSENEDGTLFITQDFEKSINDAGLLIYQLGGIDEVKKRLLKVQPEEMTQEECENFLIERNEYLKNLKKVQAQKEADREIERATKRKAEFDALVARSENGVIKTTYENISIVLRYLNTMNWGSWDLPKMSIGYTCHQYDCDGKIASTMKLDKPIKLYEDDEDDETSSMFQTGAPHGHLSKYTRC